MIRPREKSSALITLTVGVVMSTRWSSILETAVAEEPRLIFIAAGTGIPGKISRRKSSTPCGIPIWRLSRNWPAPNSLPNGIDRHWIKDYFSHQDTLLYALMYVSQNYITLNFSYVRTETNPTLVQLIGYDDTVVTQVEWNMAFNRELMTRV